MGFLAVSAGTSSCCFLLLHSPPLSYRRHHKNANFNTKFRPLPHLHISSSSCCLRPHHHQNHNKNDDDDDDDEEEGPFCNNNNNNNNNKKRTFLFLGTMAFLPFPPFHSSPSSASTTTPEIVKQSNSFLPVLNGIGILFSGVVGALCAFAQKEKSAAIATIEIMSSKLKEKEELIVSLKRNYESKFLNEQEEQAKLLGKAKEEQQALMNQLSAANRTITCFGQELKSEKSLIEELKLQINSLEIALSKSDSDNIDLENKLKEKLGSIGILEKRIDVLSLDLKDKYYVVQNLNSSHDEKELELRNLNFTYQQTKENFSNVLLHIQELKDELRKSQEELKAKDSLVLELNSRLSSLTLEKNDARIKFDVLEKEYNDFNLTSEKKAALDAKVLSEKEEELSQLKDQLVLAQNVASRNQDIIADLARERESLTESLENETMKVSNLKCELQIAQENLGKSRNESAELEKQLNESNNLRKEAESEVFELSSDCDNLQRELIDIYKMAETTAEDLKKEKELVASLNQDVQTLEKQLSNDKEAIRYLDLDLEEATKSLDEMNRNAFILSGELEKANSVISSLENEKVVLYKSLTEQRNASKVAQENMEDAQNFIMRLGKERENLMNRGKKLEEELASAKGEILRLRSQINSSKVAVNNKQVQNDEGESKVTINARKSSRRRKANSQ
ncbi:hypothetical protein RIF29_28163 [Crotalaria pallida]|uniref:MAR-binding filament-like protein 1-1 n=1 Tax=Crotalaria pallida TaxID=3830 RepID=A0AAN9EV85_CROPI